MPLPNEINLLRAEQSHPFSLAKCSIGMARFQCLSAVLSIAVALSGQPEFEPEPRIELKPATETISDTDTEPQTARLASQMHHSILAAKGKSAAAAAAPLERNH